MITRHTYTVSIEGVNIGMLIWRGRRLSLTSLDGTVRILYHRSVSIRKARESIAKNHQVAKESVLLRRVGRHALKSNAADGDETSSSQNNEPSDERFRIAVGDRD